jgi:hypothetical protein
MYCFQHINTHWNRPKPQVADGMAAVALSSVVCHVSTQLAAAFGMPSQVRAMPYSQPAQAPLSPTPPHPPNPTQPLCYTSDKNPPKQSITFITGMTVALATAFPKLLGRIAPSGEGLAVLLMQVSGCGSA